MRFALHQDDELVPFPERSKRASSAGWRSRRTPARRFTAEQRRWLERIRDHIAASFAIETDDFEYAPFAQQGGIGKAYQVFGEELTKLLDELNEELVA